MGDSMAERMEAGWQAARYWEMECEAARAERDGYLETIRATFRVLESRGQAPDDNAPLSVTVRRVLDLLDRVTAERDALKKRVADAPVADVINGGFSDYPRPMVGEDVPFAIGTRVALLRLEDGE